MPLKLYKIVTPRIIIRPYQLHEAALLKDAIDSSLEHLHRFMIWSHVDPTPIEEKEVLIRNFVGKYLTGEDNIFGIYNLEETKLLGGTGLHPRRGPGVFEIGYWIRADETRKGIATEASAAQTQAAFEIEGTQKMEIRCNTQNLVSAMIPEKLGYAFDFTHEEDEINPDGSPGKSQVFALRKSDFKLNAHYPKIEIFDYLGRKL